MRLAARPRFLLLVPLALACAGIRVESDRDPDADLAAFRGYAWLDPPLRELPRRADSVPLDPERLVGAVRYILEEFPAEE